MQRYELLKSMTIEEMGHYLCYWHDDCNVCPVKRFCHEGHNGFIDYLGQEVKPGEVTRNTPIE